MLPSYRRDLRVPLHLIKLLTVLLLFPFSFATAQQQAAQSDGFVDSIGINIHLIFTETPYYTNFPLVKSSLQTLGIRHIRDGVMDTGMQDYYDRHKELAAIGIKGLYVVTPDQSAALLQQWPSRVGSAFEAYENPNEYDFSANWLSTLWGSMPVLSAAGKVAGYPVVGPSIVFPADYYLLGNMSGFFNYANIHNYYAGRNPGTVGWGDGGYGSIPYSLNMAKVTSGNLPVYVTETGYSTGSWMTNYVSEEVSAVYLPRLLMEHFNAGIRRSYLYELISQGGQDYGLIRADGSFKPSFYAISNLTKLLADPGGSFTPGTLTYTLAGASTSVHQLLLQKRDGTYYLALWQEVPNYEPDLHYDIPVAPMNVTLNTSSSFSGVTSYQWDRSGNVTATDLPPGQSIPLTVTDNLQIIKLSSSAACTYTLGTSTLPMLPINMLAMDHSGGTGSSPYTSTGSCTTQPTSSASWLTASASNGVLSYTAQPNTGDFRQATVTLGNASISVYQAASSAVFVNFDLNVAGGWIQMDGTGMSNKWWAIWRNGEVHTLSASIPQRINGSVYLFDYWTSGAGGTTAVSVTPPARTTTYTAHLETANYLNVTAGSGGTVSVNNPGPQLDGLSYYRPWDAVGVTATPASGCRFLRWDGSSSLSSSLSLSITAPTNLNAVFACGN
ncbi:InlB B-repeat-containing protein [Terriglobus roseus]|uniref:Putative binding domain-containing protein, N-terminal n=1 Tax=Terriglobus roseus TaxID=392734 RepID=A0A1H4TZ53_9BACT|nr:BACON domain-containing carbohydrate-binding protein [Terriglobus roseus]SEC61284.1 Putative binding domain-containing protein, N-terminal [Terriglobus roseus]